MSNRSDNLSDNSAPSSERGLPISVKFTPSDLARLDGVARELGRPRGEVIRALVRLGFERGWQGEITSAHLTNVQPPRFGRVTLDPLPAE